MEHPKSLKYFVFVIFFFLIMGFFWSLTGDTRILDTLGTISFILTLVVVVFYTYSTHRIAEDTVRPSASLHIHWAPKDPYFFRIVMVNYSKRVIHCYIKVNGRIGNTPLEPGKGGFFGGNKPFMIQPGGSEASAGVTSMRDIRKIVGEHNFNIDDLANRGATLQIDIDFSYHYPGSKNKVRVQVPYFFKFRNREWVYNM